MNEKENKIDRKKKGWLGSLFSKSSLTAIFIIGVVIAPFAFFYILNNGNPYERFWVERKVPAHLEAQGIKESEIKYESPIAPKHTINKDFYQMHYVVVFKDEPNLEYLYGVKKWGKDVVQFCEKEQVEDGNFYIGTTTKKTKHSEKSCAGYFDNRD